MSLRNTFAVLSVSYQLLLVVATVVSWFSYSHDAGIILAGFCLVNLGVSSAVLSLHFSTNGQPRAADLS